uniref:Uncharacterized protein n=1 Tax=Setaria italica TaxID=4555 RepID=K3XMN2_SETIT
MVQAKCSLDHSDVRARCQRVPTRTTSSMAAKGRWQKLRQLFSEEKGSEMPSRAGVAGLQTRWARRVSRAPPPKRQGRAEVPARADWWGRPTADAPDGVRARRGASAGQVVSGVGCFCFCVTLTGVDWSELRATWCGCAGEPTATRRAAGSSPRAVGIWGYVKYKT